MGDPVFDLRIHEEVAWGYIGCLAYSSYSAFLLSSFIFNGHKMYQDLYTKERKSLGHRRKKPEITTMYKLMLYLCQFSILFYWFADTSNVFLYVMDSDTHCYVQQTFTGITYHIAKTLMYVLFLVRLYTVYKPSAYAYNIKCITIIAVVIIIYGLILMIIMVVVWESQVYGFKSLNKFPNYCDGTLEPLTGGMIMLEDISVSIGFLAAFIVPLKKTIKGLKQQQALSGGGGGVDGGNTAQFKIQYAGTKFTIITAAAMISTFILVLVTVATDLNFIIGFDPIINAICMMLMTPYYPDNKYYQRYCCCCIACCDRRHLSYDHGKNKNKNKSDDNNKKIDTDTSRTNDQTQTGTETQIQLSTQSDAASSNMQSVTSVDTMDQLNKTAADLNPNVDNNYTEVDDENNEIP